MNDIRRYITILENASENELQKYRDEQKYWQNELKKYWPVSPELMAQYRDGSHSKNEFGNLAWYQNGKLHRDGDKPAVIWPDGDLGWFQNGEPHRDGDKPAMIYPDGTLGWLQNRQYHRFGGPAIIRPNGRQEWWWRGQHIPVKSQEEFIDYLKKHKGMQRFRVTGK